MSLGRIRGISLSRRLIEYYLLFGLACLFGTLSLAITLAWRGTLMQLLAVTVALPLLVLLSGTLVLRRTVALHQLIEEQLTTLSTPSQGLITALQPLPASSPVAVGWNRLLQDIRNQGTLSQLENRLNDTMTAMDSRRWEAIVQTFSDAIAVSDKQGRLSLVNNAFLALAGLKSQQEATGKSLLDVLSTIMPTSARVLDQLAAPGPLNLELRKDQEIAAGVWRLHRTSIAGDVFEGGSYLWTFRDITQHKLADEMRNQFVFTATHELRTPLANLKAYAETLAANENIDVEKQKGFYNIINMEATRLARFVDELLNVSQIEAGAITIARHETDIERLVQEVVEHIQPQVDQKTIRFECKLPAKFPKLRVDKDKIVAALVNLLGNAVKYTPLDGQVRLVVDSDGSFMHFHVEDTGYGISADELPRLCQKFFRSQDPRVQQISGSGLGLAFTQEVARLHGGRITVASELNKGSRFTLTLPLS